MTNLTENQTSDRAKRQLKRGDYLQQKLDEQEPKPGIPAVSILDAVLIGAILVFLIVTAAIWFRFPAQLSYENAVAETPAIAVPPEQIARQLDSLTAATDGLFEEVTQADLAPASIPTDARSDSPAAPAPMADDNKPVPHTVGFSIEPSALDAAGAESVDRGEFPNRVLPSERPLVDRQDGDLPFQSPSVFEPAAPSQSGR